MIVVGLLCSGCDRDETLALRAEGVVDAAVSYMQVWDVEATREGEPLLTTPVGVSDIASSGNLFIVDTSGGSVVVLDPRDGSLVRRMGRPGRGPGELASPGAIEVRDDGEVWVVNSHSFRTSVFDTSGVFRRRVPRIDRATPSQGAQLHWDGTGFWDIGYEADGMVVRRLNSDGEALSAGPPLPDNYRSPQVQALGPLMTDVFRQVQRRYLDLPTFSLLPDGSLWYGLTSSFSVERISADGDVIDAVRVPEAEFEFSAAERREVEDGLAAQGLRWDEASPVRRQIAKVIPHPGGLLMFQRYDEFGEVSRRVDVVKPKEGLIGSFELDYPIHWRSRPVMRADTLFYVGVGEYDVPHVVKAIVRTSR